MKAKKIPKKTRAKKTTAATRGTPKKGTRKKKAAATPVGDIMRNAAAVIQSVAKTIRP
jgi:hypothetical protein